LNDSASRYVGKVVEKNVPRVLDATDGKPHGIRKAAHDLARELRDEFRTEFDTYASSHAMEGDGRAFARVCMDRLLD
jgi:hypothetical protein